VARNDGVMDPIIRSVAVSGALSPAKKSDVIAVRVDLNDGGAVSVPADGEPGCSAATYSTSAEKSCAWPATGVRASKNIAASLVPVTFMLRSFGTGFTGIQPCPSKWRTLRAGEHGY
jgi:hypothetical protein